MPRFKHLSSADVATKSGPLDPVTVADIAAEKALTVGLKKLYPDADIIGEESVAQKPDLLKRLKLPGKVWIIDPIDGTANFAAEIPLFGVMLALVEQDEVLAGFLHDPICDDTAVAIAGDGAWMVKPDATRHRLHVAAPVPVSQMVGTVSWRYMKEPLRTHVLRRLDRLGSLGDYRCAAHQYRMLASGHCHMQLFRRLYPWDHAAGYLLHKEAGGYGRHFDGWPYIPSEVDGGLLLAPDEDSWLLLQQALLL
ncbi:MAG: inositol monophosphatase [Acidocella sp. 20-61-6]|nr:MAG: inositol monophosphatase [Acidocella sp. 20-61-6]